MTPIGGCAKTARRPWGAGITVLCRIEERRENDPCRTPPHSMLLSIRPLRRVRAKFRLIRVTAITSPMYDRIVASFENCPVVDRGGYSYFVHPLTDGVPRMDPALLRDFLDWMISAGDFRCDIIAAPEAMGIPLAAPLSLELGIPYTVIRKKAYCLPGEVSVEQRTGYSSSVMRINGIRRGDRVTLVDDVASTGGTLVAIIRALRDEIGAEIVDVVIPVDKGEGIEAVERETGVRVRSLVKVGIADGKVVCTLLS